MTTFRTLDEMTAEDYAALGLRSGIEIHQQLFTEKKLFCRCPAGRYSREYDAEILRHMRPTLSELGEYDGTALMEFKTKKEIIYQINHETVCTYEMDDTPPFMINSKALNISLEIAMLLNFKMASEIHIARKQYLDGSIPTGFQRTTIVGIDGWIPYKDRRIGLIQLGLEEDACREVSDVGHVRTYITDRLGMPLIETVTRPDMRTPQEAADVANILRWSVRSTGKVRTGIGAARQDVNVSITGGTRVEIKGVPRIPRIPLLIHNEALRQHSLLAIRDELVKRGITADNLKFASANVTHMLGATAYDPIRQAISRGEEIHCVNLEGMAGIPSHFTQPGKVFSKEISDRVRVVACITHLPNILTSESREETIDSFIWGKIQRAVGAGPKDAQVLVWGNPVDVRTAVKEIVLRAREAAEGVPSETRQALADGTNGFERILPGPDRMYPDTDLPPIEITKDRLNTLRENVSSQLWTRMEWLREIGIPHHLLIPIASSPQAPLFKELVTNLGLPAARLAVLMFEKPTAWRRAGLPVAKLSAEVWRRFFQAAAESPVLMEDADAIFETFLTGEKPDMEETIKAYVPPDVSEKDLRREISEAVSSDLSRFKSTSPDKKHRYLMRRVMESCRGRVAAERAAALLRKALEMQGEKA
jgi:glutamyl-tRNA(Gln) amidotransferase subunit E